MTTPIGDKVIGLSKNGKGLLPSYQGLSSQISDYPHNPLPSSPDWLTEWGRVGNHLGTSFTVEGQETGGQEERSTGGHEGRMTGGQGERRTGGEGDRTESGKEDRRTGRQEDRKDRWYRDRKTGRQEGY